MHCHVLCLVSHSEPTCVALARGFAPCHDRCRQAFSFGKGDENALLYLRELRQNGTDRRGELESLILGHDIEWKAIKAAEDAEVRQTMGTLCMQNAGLRWVSCIPCSVEIFSVGFTADQSTITEVAALLEYRTALSGL